MSWSFSNITNPKAKKSHICECCKLMIPVGYKYFNLSGIFEGSFNSVKSHIECEQLFSKSIINAMNEGASSDEIFYQDFGHYLEDSGFSLKDHLDLIKTKYNLKEVNHG